jgi:hypothetical protein
MVEDVLGDHVASLNPACSRTDGGVHRIARNAP